MRVNSLGTILVLQDRGFLRPPGCTSACSKYTQSFTLTVTHLKSPIVCSIPQLNYFPIMGSCKLLTSNCPQFTTLRRSPTKALRLPPCTLVRCNVHRGSFITAQEFYSKQTHSRGRYNIKQSTTYITHSSNLQGILYSTQSYKNELIAWQHRRLGLIFHISFKTGFTTMYRVPNKISQFQ